MTTPVGHTLVSGPSRKRKPQAPDNGPRKRAKVAVACNVCKIKKSKCDGVRPVCGPCIKRNGGKEECSYRTDDQVLSRSKRRALAEIPPEPSPRRARRRNLSAVPLTAEIDDDSGLATHEDVVVLPLADAVNTPNRKTQMSVRSSNPSRRGRRRSVGISSRVAREEDSTVAGREEVSSPIEHQSSLRTWHTAEAPNDFESGTTSFRTVYPTSIALQLLRNDEEEIALLQSDIVLPSKRTADHLLEVYWTRSHGILPWLDRDKFCREYSYLWVGRHRARTNQKSFHCTLNLIFAIASTLDLAAGSGSQLQLAANTYYIRAKGFLHRNLLDVSHFQVLQTLLLAVQYLQSTKFSQQCLRTMSLAAWMAQDLGLHLPQTTRWIENVQDRELVRRVWHGCVMLDRITAMSFGRTPRIPQNVADRVEHPRALLSLSADIHRVPPSDQPATFDFFVTFYELHHILGDILESFYLSGEDNRPDRVENSLISASRLDKIFQIEQSLSQWKDGLEVALQEPFVGSVRGELKHDNRHINILYARYFYIHMLLYRSFVSQARKFEAFSDVIPRLSPPTVSQRVITECQVSCIGAARQLIGNLFDNLPTDDRIHDHDVLPEWWNVLSYVYTASIVLIAAYMLPLVLQRVSSASLNETLNQGYRILRHLEHRINAARHVREMLGSLKERVTRATQPDASEIVIWQNPARGITDESVDEPISAVEPEDPDGDFATSFIETPNLSWLDESLFDWDPGQWETSSPERDS